MLLNNIKKNTQINRCYDPAIGYQATISGVPNRLLNWTGWTHTDMQKEHISMGFGFPEGGGGIVGSWKFDQDTFK